MHRSGLRLAAGAFALAVAAPAFAQENGEAEVEALLDASGSPEAALTLARRQADEGDPLGAAATLERALLANPDSNEVRLYYVAILCRVADRQRAAIELAKANGTASDVQAACGELAPVAEAGRSAHAWRGHVSAGLAFDSDATGAIALQLDIPGFSYASEDGLAFIASAGIDGRIVVAGHSFFYAGLAGQTHNDLSGPDYDYQAGSAAAGLGTRVGGAEVSAGGVLRHAVIDDIPYVTETGGEAQLRFAVARDTRVTLRGEVVDQAYVDHVFLSRDGTRYDASADLQGGRGDTLSYVIGTAYERKTAVTSYLAYRGHRFYGAMRVPFGNAYALLGGTARHIDYYDDAFTRDYVENRYYGRAALGLKLGGGLTAEGAASYTLRDYNAASSIRDYRSWGGELRLIYRFGDQEGGR